jgi:LysM repeat protein
MRMMPIVYTVQFGDAFPSIAQRFGTNLTELVHINNICYPFLIYAGQNLIIPVNETSIKFPPPLAWDWIDRIIGKKGSRQDGVLKFTFPRYDLGVHIGPVSVEADLGLTSWIAFHQIENQSMVMGDLVLLESEIDPVISQLIATGFEVTALHNHLLREVPRVMYLHISGKGNAIRLAQSIMDILSTTQTPLAPDTARQTLPQGYWSAIEAIFRKKGNYVGRVLQLSFPRADTIRENGMVIPPSMGISQAINFQAEGQNAAITGDFVLIAQEVNPVIRTLKENGITVTALHNHMLYESPRLFFLHFWAVDNPQKLAYGLKRALEQTNSRQ